MNSREGKTDKFSDKISLIYFTQIEAFHVSVRVGPERLAAFVLAGKIFKCNFVLSLFFSYLQWMPLISVS